MKRFLTSLLISILFLFGLLVGVITYDVVANDGHAIYLLMEGRYKANPAKIDISVTPQIEELEALDIESIKEEINKTTEIVNEKLGDRQYDINTQEFEGAGYYYQFLSDNEKAVYRVLVEAFTNIESGNKIPYADQEEMNRAVTYVYADHPEFFYVGELGYTHYTLGGQVQSTVLSVTYNDTKAGIISNRDTMEAIADEMMSDLEPAASEYDKVKHVYEAIINGTDYVLDAPENQQITSALLYHQSVCSGYAKAMQFILNRAGMDTIFVEGYDTENRVGHAWLIVKIDGQYYHVDPTWGEYSFSNKEKRIDDINYSYLNVTTRDIEQNHIISDTVPLPICTAKDANYYVREGLYFTDYDENKLAEIFDRAYAEDKSNVSFKCETVELYEQMKKSLLKGERIFDFLRDSKTVSYSDDSNQRTICFWL